MNALQTTCLKTCSAPNCTHLGRAAVLMRGCRIGLSHFPTLLITYCHFLVSSVNCTLLAHLLNSSAVCTICLAYHPIFICERATSVFNRIMLPHFLGFMCSLMCMRARQHLKIPFIHCAIT
jgi:hypothetical protein